MPITFETYWPLALLIGVPFVWWMRTRSLTNFNVRQRSLQAGLRAGLIALLGLTLTQPSLWWRGQRVSVAYVVDASGSVDAPALAAAGAWIERTQREQAPDHARGVLFAARPESLSVPELVAALRTPQGGPRSERGFDRATNVERALDEALRNLAPGHVKRIVLFTDGHETEGALAAAIPRLQREGVRVFTQPLAAAPRGEAWVDAIAVPELVVAGEPFDVEVRVYSQTERMARLSLHDGARPIDARQVVLREGLSAIAMQVTLPDSGPATLDARLDVEGDPLPDNNRVRQPVYVDERPTVLYVEGRPASARYLTRALTEGGFEVESGGPRALPASVEELDRYAVVILSDVAPSALTDAQMAAVATYVSEAGGGFVLAGGESVYGADGYSDTPIERVLPVTFDVKDDPDEFAMVIVLDKSWSMSGPKIDLSKEASKAAVDVLPDDNQIGLVAFNNGFEWAVPLQKAANRQWIQERISTIVPSGHTNIYPALEEAFKGLLAIEAQTKHVLLLSDGRTYTDDYEGLVSRMAEQEITVSTVAVGQQADRELLTNIGRWGKGRTYFIEDAKEVPQIFTEETKQAAKKTLREESFRPRLVGRVEMLQEVDFEAAPPLQGFTATQAKETAELLLVTGREDDPILARWQYGLGRSVAFTSDVKDRWAADWVTWAGYGKFWTQVVRDTARRDTARKRGLVVARRGDEAIIAVEAVGRDGAFQNLDEPEVEIHGPGDASSVIRTRQVGPGSYEATVPLERDADYVFRVASGPEDQIVRAIAFSYPDEYRFYPPDTALLEAVARDTGGSFAAPADEIFTARGDAALTRYELWPFLLTLALLLYLADILLRRVRLFEDA